MKNPVPWDGKKVLIVDDSKMIQEQLKEHYESIGFQVSGIVSNGVEALDVIKKEDIDLLSLDIIMPVMHGVECYQKVKELKPDLKVIFISRLGSSQGFKDTIKEQIPEEIILGKPLSRGSLLITIKNIYGISSDYSDVSHAEGISEDDAS